MQSAPRPPASVPLGGSLRASRAALLTRPQGPLAAVDLADGRALLVERLGPDWVVLAEAPPAFLPREPVAPQPECEVVPARRRRLGTALALAAALGAAAVALATGFSGTPAPAVAGPTAQPSEPLPRPPPRPTTGARGGHAVSLPPKAAPAPAPATPPAAPPAAVTPRARAPARLPELPSAPSLSGS